jgi:hypothetical protein
MMAKMSKVPPATVAIQFQTPKRELGSCPGSAAALMRFTYDWMGRRKATLRNEMRSSALGSLQERVVRI